MSSGYEPVLHALAVEPAVARPGDTVRLTFRTRNVGARTSPPGTVVFALPDGIGAVGDAAVPLPAVEPGEVAEAILCARVERPFDDRTELALQASLLLGETSLASNICTLCVRSRAVLDGTASGTFVEPLDANTVRVRAHITNEGDGAARVLRVRLPAPAGCRRLDGDEVATLDVARLEPGDSIALAFDARIEHVMAAVRAEGAEVQWCDGMRRALPVRDAVALQPLIAPPTLALCPRRRAVDAVAELCNDGWSHAAGVCVAIDLPAELRLVEESVAIDGVPVAVTRARRGSTPLARLQRRPEGYALAIAMLPARSTTRLSFSANHAGEYGSGTLRIRVDDRAVEAAFRAEQRREVRVEPFDVPLVAAPGEQVTVRARVVNAGDVAERVGVALMRDGVVETAPLRRTVDAGGYEAVDLSLSLGAALRDGTRVPFAVAVFDDDGELVRTELSLTVREPVVATSEPDDARPEPVGPALHAALWAPGAVVAGALLALRLDVDVDDAVERLTIRVREPDDARYVDGSTSAGGFALLDAVAGSLLHGPGLTLRAIPAATRVTVGWSVLVGHDAADTIAIGAELDADGRTYEVTPLAVAVLRAGAFATRPAELPYHVDACALAPPATSTPLPNHDDERRERSVERDQPNAIQDGTLASPPSARWDEIARLLQGVRCRGLVVHVLALRALFPEPLDGAAQPPNAALDAAGHAMRDVFDRLFVKLRIPGFVVGVDDLEDEPLRRAVLALADPFGDALERAPLGAPAVLRLLLAAIPPQSDAPAGIAASAYLRALDAMLASYEDLPLAVFDEALARGRDDALDDARAALLAAIDGHLAARPIAC